MLAVNIFLGNVVKFLEVFRSSIDYYDIDKDTGKINVDEEEVDNSIGMTLFLLFTIAFSIFFTGLMVIFNIITFVVNCFIAPYIGKVALYTIKILALITAIILTYYILVKFNQVNSIIDKQYIDFFIKSFQNICKGVS